MHTHSHTTGSADADQDLMYIHEAVKDETQKPGGEKVQGKEKKYTKNWVLIIW